MFPRFTNFPLRARRRGEDSGIGHQAVDQCGCLRPGGGSVGINVRKVVGELYGEDAAKALTVQYGGSMNPKNAEELLSKPDVDGGLIGGASLKADQFAVIVDAATKG